MANSFRKNTCQNQKIFPNRNFVTIKEKKLTNLRMLQENVINEYVIYFVITVV